MAWTLLIIGGLFEAGWPIGLKMAETPGRALAGWLIATLCMAASMALLYLAQRQIPIGTAYAVWTGIGAAGAFACGLLLYGDPATFGRFAGVGLIISGVVVLKLAH
jgi:quaternary ammonium compound-resistance protein SugE